MVLSRHWDLDGPERLVLVPALYNFIILLSPRSKEGGDGGFAKVPFHEKVNYPERGHFIGMSEQFVTARYRAPYEKPL